MSVIQQIFAINEPLPYDLLTFSFAQLAMVLKREIQLLLMNSFLQSSTNSNMFYLKIFFKRDIRTNISLV